MLLYEEVIILKKILYLLLGIVGCNTISVSAMETNLNTYFYNYNGVEITETEYSNLESLGFTDNESNAYIYRETLITVIIGIIIRLIITKPLHGMVMSLLEVDHMMFLRTIEFKSYIFSSLLTLIFAIIMLFITYYKIKKIDMIESLKSVE